MQQQDGSGIGRTWLLVATTGTVRTNIGNSSLSGTTQIAANTWHHIAVVYDGTTLQLYLDGALEASQTVAAEANVGTMLIGVNKALNSFFAGQIDELVIYDRTLAAYEIVNLRAYGLGTWTAATLNGDTWSYTIPTGANGLEGLYQLNVRGIDVLGNVTPQGGQRVWRGEIDTRPPEMTFAANTLVSGNTTTTTYSCTATDFSLVEETTCLPGKSPAIPMFRTSDMIETTYAAVNPWYAVNITDTARLYRLDAHRTYSDDPVPDQTMIGCDAYGHCNEVGESILRVPSQTPDVEILVPSSGTVLTATTPVTISGDIYAADGLRTLAVTVNGVLIHAEGWDTADQTIAPWQFQWTPPGEGIYHFVPTVDDWTGKTPPMESMPTALSAPSQDVSIAQKTTPDDPIFLPWVTNKVSGNSNQSTDTTIYLPLISVNSRPDNAHSGPITTLYVDLKPPAVAINASILTTTHEIGDTVVKLTDSAADSVKLHRVDVRIDDGPWQRTGLDGTDGWKWLWWFDSPPDGESYIVSARATDLAGRTAEVSQEITVDIVPPRPGEISLAYTNSAGITLPMEPGDLLPDATMLQLSWTAASDGSGDVTYQAGFSITSTPDLDDLTSYDGPGTHRQGVGGQQRWYATVRFMDAFGNNRTITVGPVYVQ